MALIDQIQQQLDDNTVSQLSQQLGADPDTTRQAVPAALSALLGGLSHNVQQPGGAQQLENALANHGGGGGLLDSLGGLGGLLGGGGGTTDGGGILGHIFGGHQPAVANQVGQRTGLNAGQAARLLMLLAPFVLGYLNRARQQRQQQAPAGDLGAGTVPATTGPMGGAMESSAGSGPFGGITDILHGERTRIDQAHPEHSGILGDLFDRNHDGHVMDDIAGMAGGLLRGGR
ncbi:MAG: DUF937 domain-containing protein [Thermoanaerobaculia bacterium]